MMRLNFLACLPPSSSLFRQGFSGLTGMRSQSALRCGAFLLNDYIDNADYVVGGHADWPVAFMGCGAAFSLQDNR